MANFLFTRAGGIWANDTDLLPAEMADLDYKTANAINGQGGVYALTDDLVIGGVPASQVVIDANCFLHGSSIGIGTTTTELSINGATACYGPATFGNSVTIERSGSPFVVKADTTLESSVVNIGTDESAALNIKSFAQFYGTTIYQGGAYFYASTQFVGAALFKASATFQSNASFSGTTTLGGNGIVLQAPLTAGTGGSIVHNVTAGDPTEVSVTYSPLEFHEVVMFGSVLMPGDVVWNIDDTGCQDGNEILFANQNTTHFVNVVDPDNNVIKQLKNTWGRFVRIGGSWSMTQFGTF
jgi:hypothetical protein